MTIGRPLSGFLFALSCIVVGTAFQSVATADEASTESKKLRVLLVAGGCCHDYVTQTQLLKAGIEKRMSAEVTVVLNKSTSTETRFDIYEKDDWAKGYDVVIHDECSAKVTERPYIDRILAAHRSGVPAVNLHCAMHSYRWGDFRQPVEPGADNFAWYEMIGVQSTAHGPKEPIEVVIADSEHPITKGMKGWTTGKEELYNNVRVYGATTPLIVGKQMVPPRKQQLKINPDAKPVLEEAVVAWTNRYGPKKTRIFSLSLGHQNETVKDDRYLEIVVRGLKWAVDHK